MMPSASLFRLLDSENVFLCIKIIYFKKHANRWDLEDAKTFIQENQIAKNDKFSVLPAAIFKIV